jgi:hypothetical protein
MKEAIIDTIIPKQLYHSLWVSEQYRAIRAEISITHRFKTEVRYYIDRRSK